MYLIDPPSPYHSIEVWRDFLKRMEALDLNDKTVQWAIKKARATIIRKEKETTAV